MSSILAPVLIIGGIAYAAVVALVRKVSAASLTRVAVCTAMAWWVGLSAITWCWFRYVEAQAAAVHQSNVGIPVIFIVGWFLLVLLPPIVGTVMVAVTVWTLRIIRNTV